MPTTTRLVHRDLDSVLDLLRSDRPAHSVPEVPEAPEAPEVLATIVRAERGGSPVADRAGLAVAQKFGVDLDALMLSERFTAKPGQVVRLPLTMSGLPRRWLLVGVGADSPADRRHGAASLARATLGTSIVATSIAAPGASGTRAVRREQTRAAVEGLVIGAHRHPFTGRSPRTETAPPQGFWLIGDMDRDVVAAGQRHAAATSWARDLAATPSSLKTPQWMADQVIAAIDERGSQRRLRVTVLDRDALQRKGFGGHLAVGGGSASPPVMVRIDYHPSSGQGVDPGRRIVLVGKGITFDTGGISLKPRPDMALMKTDMAGAAAVLATILACPDTQVRRPVTALLALAENHLSGSAYRPGDVVQIHGGSTVEIANTDAEGRLVLADAISYAARELDPEVIIDVATLTGAARLSLGRRIAPFLSDDDALARELIAAGEAAGEPLWRLPLVSDYEGALASSIADLRQVPESDQWGAGVIVPGMFLRTFANSRRWAHLDIAGAARSDKPHPETGKGPTGFGARLLLRWLETLS